MKRFIVLLLCLAAPAVMADTGLQKLIQLVDYVGVDYAGAVADGQVTSPDEYAEMQDFAAAIAEQVKALPASPARESVKAQAERLAALVDAKRPPAEVAALSGTLRRQLIEKYNVTVVPRHVPDLDLARRVFSENCAACHGVEGRGDGPLAASLEPRPTDFHNRDRYRQRSVYGLYSTITHGVQETAMKGFPQFSEDERWSLAFLVGQLATLPDEQMAGAAQFDAGQAAELGNLSALTTLSPQEAGAEYGPAAPAVMAYLRSHPDRLFDSRSPLTFTRQKLEESLAVYEQGDAEAAYRVAVAAYLEGFELAEHSIDAVDPDLRHKIEGAMTRFRGGYRDGATLAEQQERAEGLFTLLDEAQARVDGTSLTGASAFASAFLILVREGLEALLVVAALAAFLIKTERRDGLPYLHAGWIGALVLGVVTWFVATYVFDIGGAQRELTEGVAAIVAAVVLFYVGFWLHSKTSAQQWQRFINGSVEKALTSGTLWALAGLSFIAVYREVFETILFYQALWVQADKSGQGMTVAGVGAGAGALVVLAWLILRYSTRLPLRQFFGVTGIFMFVLAVVFAGKGVAALQEAGKLPVDPVQFPRIELLGIYPNMESLSFQTLLIGLALLLIFVRGRNRARRSTSVA